VAGSRTPRMSVASTSTAAERPTPSCFSESWESVAKIEKTKTITVAARRPHKLDPVKQGRGRSTLSRGKTLVGFPYIRIAASAPPRSLSR
jgi:hypothetical protein